MQFSQIKEDKISELILKKELKNTNGIILIYDCTDEYSYEFAVNLLNMILQINNKILIFLVANKIDKIKNNIFREKKEINKKENNEEIKEEDNEENKEDENEETKVTATLKSSAQSIRKAAGSSTKVRTLTNKTRNTEYEVLKSKQVGNVTWVQISDGKVIGWVKKKYLNYTGVSSTATTSTFDTGGYTGEWGSTGKLAMLHEKELVLNKEDTQNILQSVELMREITQSIDTNANWASMGLGLLNAVAASSGSEALEQNVTITAEFPNATDHNEIEEAFKTLINEASQYANRY